MTINIKQNQAYYTSGDSTPCDCNYCKNYYNQIKMAYPNVCSYLESMGIDVLHPLELSPLEPDKNNLLEYCVCQYLVFGSCEDTYHHQIDDVQFSIGISHPYTGEKEAHFVLDFSPIFLPMQLSL